MDIITESDNIQDLVYKAEKTSKEAHSSINQKRKYTGEPYWRHPERVVFTLVTNGFQGNPIVLSAAWLHDVIEDVYPKNKFYSFAYIQDNFGTQVAEIVKELTDISKPSDGNRAKRKEKDANHLVNASYEAKMIKLADLLDNTIDIKKNDKRFYPVFRKEALNIIDKVYIGMDNELMLKELNGIL